MACWETWGRSECEWPGVHLGPCCCWVRGVDRGWYLPGGKGRGDRHYKDAVDSALLWVKEGSGGRGQAKVGGLASCFTCLHAR